MSESSLENVRDMIDAAFGDIDKNTVDFTLLQTVLFVLASRLKILDRRIAVELLHPYETSSTVLWVSDVKVHAKTHKKKKKMLKIYRAAEPYGKSKQKKIERPIGKTLAHSYHATVTKQTYTEPRDEKKPALTPGYKKYPGKQAASSEMSEKSSSSSRLSVKRQPSTKPKENFAFEWASDKHELKFGELLVEEHKEEFSDSRSSTDTLLPTSMSSENTRMSVYRSSGSSASMKKETKVTINLPEADEFFKSPLLDWDEPGDIVYENLIIVQRVSFGSKEDKESYTNDERSLSYTPSSIVTKDQFGRIVKSVIELQKMYGNVHIPGLTIFMDILRRSTSLSQGAAGLQLSARLEVAELALEKLLQLLTILFNQLQNVEGKGGTDSPALQHLDDEEDDSWQNMDDDDAKSVESRADPVPSRSAQAQKRVSQAPSVASRHRKSMAPIMPKSIKQATATPTKLLTNTSDFVTYEELDVAMMEVIEEYRKKVASAAFECNKTTDGTLKEIRVTDIKVTKGFKELDMRMIDIEKAVTEYADNVNVIDMNMTTQMTSYQDELTQMSHELENALDVMAETLAAQTSDVNAIADTKIKFNNFQTDIGRTLEVQKELKEMQTISSMEIQGLVKDVSDVKERKSDRNEVAEALNVKADISALNGRVFLYQYSAIQGDIEKKILRTYGTINSAEIIWQRAINDLTREFADRAEDFQLDGLRTNIKYHLQMLKGRIQFMADILGELKPQNIMKDILHKESCLACSLPGMEEIILNPIISASSTSKPSEKPGQFGDNKICYPGKPIPHPRDPRSHVPTCPKYCGGPTNTMGRDSDTGFYHRAIRDPANGAGDEVSIMYTKQKPCIPCNRRSSEKESKIQRAKESKVGFVEDVVEEESEVASEKCPWYCPCQYNEQNQARAPPMD